MATKLVPFTITPGINRNNTSYENEGSWVDCDKIRFKDGNARKIGGWAKQAQTQLSGVARDIISWTALDSTKFIGIATNKKVYIYSGGVYYDVTPLRVTNATTTNALSTTSGSPSVKVHIPAHNVLVGDSVLLSNSSPAGGLTLSGEYIVQSIVDLDNFTVNATSNATSTTTNSGGTLTYSLYLQGGNEFNMTSQGWSAGKWSQNTWGTPRTASTLVASMRQWSLDTWGEDLLANPRGGSIYTWDKTNGLNNRLYQIPNSPAQCNFTFVSYPTRHLVALGCTDEDGVTFDPMLVRWSDSEDYTTWLDDVDNEAGSQRLEHGNFIVGAEATKTEIIVLTDTSAYSMNYEGGDYIFGFTLLGDAAGCVGPHASANVNGVAYWMAPTAFYMYNGTLVTMPCTLRDAIFDANNDLGLNPDQKDMVFTGVNQEFSEIIWLYPSKGSTVCNRYVIYNYLENLWYDGSLSRSVWADAKIYAKPYAMSNDGYLYVHEQGKDDDGKPMLSFITSGMFDIGDGDQVMFVDKFVPDFNQVGNIQLDFSTRRYPEASSDEVLKSYVVPPGTGKVSMRARGRQAKVKVSSNSTNGDFMFGKNRLSMAPDGGR